MLASVRLQSKQNGEINKFLSAFYNTDLEKLCKSNRNCRNNWSICR